MWTAVLAQPGPAPRWLLVLLVVVLAAAGPGSVVGIDIARTHNPSANLGVAQSMVNMGGFLASLVVLVAMGGVLTALGGFTPEAFRVAWLVQYPVWGLAVVGILVARRQGPPGGRGARRGAAPAAGGAGGRSRGSAMRARLPASWRVGGGMEFAELAREQLPRLYGLARQLVGEDAEDLVQECLLKAYRSYAELRDRAGRARLADPDHRQLRPRPLPQPWQTRARGPAARRRGLLALPRDRRRGPVPVLRLPAPGLPAPVRPRGRVGRAARPAGDLPAAARARPHARREHQTRRPAARRPARHAAGPAAPRAQAVREGPLDLRPRNTTCCANPRGREHDPLRGRAARAVGLPVRRGDAREPSPDRRAPRRLPPLLRRDRLPRTSCAGSWPQSEPELPADVGVRMEAFLATLEGGTDDRPDAQG